MAARSAVSRKKLGEWITDGKEPVIVKTDKDPPKDSWHKRFCNRVSVAMKDLTKEFERPSPSPAKPKFVISGPTLIPGMDPKMGGVSVMDSSANYLPIIQEEKIAVPQDGIDSGTLMASPVLEPKSARKKPFWKKATSAMDPRTLFSKEQKDLHQNDFSKEEKRMSAIFRREPLVAELDGGDKNMFGAFQTLITREGKRGSLVRNKATTLEEEEEEERLIPSVTGEDEEELDVVHDADVQEREEEFLEIIAQQVQVNPSPSQSSLPYSFPSLFKTPFSSSLQALVRAQSILLSRPLSAYHNDGSRMKPDFFNALELIQLSREDCPEDLLKFYDRLGHLKNNELPYRSPHTPNYKKNLLQKRLRTIQDMFCASEKWGLAQVAQASALRSHILAEEHVSDTVDVVKKFISPPAKPDDVPRENRFPTEEEIDGGIEHGIAPPKFMTVEVEQYKRLKESIRMALATIDSLKDVVHKKDKVFHSIFDAINDPENPPMFSEGIYVPFVYQGGSEDDNDTDEAEGGEGKADHSTAGTGGRIIPTHKELHEMNRQAAQDKRYVEAERRGLYKLDKGHEGFGEKDGAAKSGSIANNGEIDESHLKGAEGNGRGGGGGSL